MYLGGAEPAGGPNSAQKLKSQLCLAVGEGNLAAAHLMKSCWLKTVFAGGVLLAGCSLAPAAEWSQYRGPGTAGVSAEKTPAGWPESGPKLRWRVPASPGFSSFVVAGGKVFTIVSRNVDGAPVEVCVAWDAESGNELWAAPVGVAKYQGGGETGAEGNTGGDGPRSTPAVSAGRVFIYNPDMVLQCLDAAKGKTLWKKNIAAEFQGKNIGWKSAMSPVVDGNLVYVAGGGPGQAMLALTRPRANSLGKPATMA